VQIPILAGVYADQNPALRIAYPVNMIPVPGQDGIADGYLRPAEGIEFFTTAQGVDRGAIVWKGDHYRVSGTKLIKVTDTGTVAVLGDVGGTGPVRMDFSFDLLGILSNGLLYYWDGSVLTFVSDPNMPTNLIDMLWIDGYFMVTDGTFVVVTNLSNPATVNPLKYGSTDQPTPVKALLKVLNEVHVVSETQIDVFQNVGGQFFPFARVATALITKGAVGTRAACVFQDTVAFIGGDRNEAPSVYRGHNAQTVQISSREIDNLLLEYTKAQLAAVTMQTIVDRGSKFLYINLPDRTIVYDAVASAAAQQPVWFILTSAIVGFSRYRAANLIRIADKWISGDPTSAALATWSTTDSQHYGGDVRWEFSTPLLRNEGRGAILHRLELLALTGSVPTDTDPQVATSFSLDGKTWSLDRPIHSGQRGDRTKRLVWWRNGMWRNYRIQRFRGDSSSRLTALKLEAEVEPLSV